jgi:hypothetical protein
VAAFHHLFGCAAQVGSTSVRVGLAHESDDRALVVDLELDGPRSLGAPLGPLRGSTPSTGPELELHLARMYLALLGATLTVTHTPAKTARLRIRLPMTERDSSADTQLTVEG